MDPLNVNEALAARPSPLREFIQWVRGLYRGRPAGGRVNVDKVLAGAPPYLDPWEYRATSWPGPRSWCPNPTRWDDSICESWQREGWEIVSAVPMPEGQGWGISVVLRKRRVVGVPPPSGASGLSLCE